MVFRGVVVLENPVLKTILGLLRDKHTPRHMFRDLLEEAGIFTAYEISKELPTREISVETPLGVTKSLELNDEKIVVIAILRAGLPYAQGMLRVWRRARLGFIAAARLEESIKRDERGNIIFDVDVSYVKLPKIKGHIVVIADPMLATASTLIKVLSIVTKYQIDRVYITSVIAAKPGIDRLRDFVEKLPIDVKVYALAVDEKLNDRGFIVPGLGDAGDRAFG